MNIKQVYSEQEGNIMDKKEVLLLEKLLHGIIKDDEENPKQSCAELSKQRGIVEGARTGLRALEKLKNGIPLIIALGPLNSRVNQSIYSLLVAEEKFMKREDSTLRCEIAYYDNLTTTLQLIRTRLSALINKNTKI